MIYCPNCGTANREGSKYCNQCGARLTPEEGIRCQICGAINSPENEKCVNCGASLKPAPPPEEKPAEELPKVPVFPEEIILTIEEEAPDFLADLRARVQEVVLPEEEREVVPPEEEKPIFIAEERYEEEKPFEEEELPPPPAEEKPAVAVEYREEELPDWLKEAEEIVLPPEPSAPADWLKEVEIPWLEEEIVEVPVLAEIPPWLEALRPVEKAPEAPPPEEEAEEKGVLQGLKGLLKPAAIFGPPEKIPLRGEVAELSLGGEEIQKLIKLKPAAPAVKIKAPPKEIRTPRLIHFILLLAVLIPMLLGWPSMPSGSPSTPPEVEKFFQTVEALPPGSFVLVAFDYEPYMAGEMESVAYPVLTHLKGKGCRVALISLNPAGPALAQALGERAGFLYGEEFVNLGYIPGVEAGLRALGTSEGWLVRYDYLQGKPLDSFPAFQSVKGLKGWNLIVLFSGQSSTLLGWIEQVGSMVEAPMVAGVISGLKPYAEPYLGSGQLKGLLGGMADAAFYEAMLGKPLAATRAAPVQAFALLIALLVILVGSLMRGESHA
jgi:hypothetical protein